MLIIQVCVDVNMHWECLSC